MPDPTANRRRRALAATMLATLTALALLSGCGAGGRAADSGAAEPATAPPAGGEDGQGSGDDAGEREQEKQGVTGSQGTSGTQGAGKQGTTGSAASDRQLLTYTASLRVRVDDTTERTARAEDVVTKAGGYVENQSQNGEDAETAYATTTFRVPSARYRTVLDQLGKLGKRTSLTQQTDNVTQQVADVDARVESANSSLDRLRALLKDASDVDDLIRIEAEINRREADLEALQATQRALAKQVSYATITLTLTGKTKITSEERETGFLAGLRAGWNGFVGFLTGVATVAGAVLPFLILVVPGAVVAYVLWRRQRRRPATPRIEESEPAAG